MQLLTVFPILLGVAQILHETSAKNVIEASVKAAVGHVCNACHARLAECTRYPFLTKIDQEDISNWSKCMEKPFKRWRRATGVNFWPSSKKLTTGPIGGFWYGRLECFEYMVGTSQCVSCGIAYLYDYQRLYRSGNDCWDIVDPERSEEKKPN